LTSADVRVMREALAGLHEARARLEDLLLAGASPEVLELYAAVLSTVKRLLSEMDLDERIRGQVRMLRASRPRGPRAGPPGSRPPAPQEPAPEDETQVLPRVPRERPDRRRP
jgi:hypothetical protein